MDLYILVKFLHIVSAVIWLGAGLSVTVLAIRADHANDHADLIKVIEQVVFLSPRLIVPASALTLVFGLIMVVLGQSFADLWIILGLVGFAASFAIGVGIIKPVTEAIAATVAAEGASANAIAQARRLLRIVKVDMVLLYVIVADMVLKPRIEDVGLLAAMAVILVGAAAAFLLRADRRPMAARA